MSEAHGRIHRIISLHGEIKIIATYHPAAILRNPKIMEEAKRDWKTIGEEVKRICQQK
jgi:uracil-DNA glycosylase family 4